MRVFQSPSSSGRVADPGTQTFDACIVFGEGLPPNGLGPRVALRAPEDDGKGEGGA